MSFSLHVKTNDYDNDDWDEKEESFCLFCLRTTTYFYGRYKQLWNALYKIDLCEVLDAAYTESLPMMKDTLQLQCMIASSCDATCAA